MMLLANDVTVQDLIEFIERVKEVYVSFGVGAAIGLPFLETLIPILPLFLMTAFNILSYGVFWGYVYTYIGTVSGTLLIFAFMRYISTKEFRHSSTERPHIKRALEWIENTHPLLHILVLMIPFSPTFFINYSMGLTKMKTTTYIFITMVSRAIMLFICIPLGMTLITLYNNSEFGGVTIMWLTFTGIAVFGSIISGQIITKRIKAKRAVS